MAVKCNITSKVKEKLKSSNWGFAINLDLERALAENYLEYLACKDFSLKSCNDFDEECARINATNTVVFNCNMNLVGMSFNLINVGADIEFYVGAGDIFGGKSPYTYSWTYDTNHFDLVDQSNDKPLLKLKVKNGVNVSSLTTRIDLQVQDANGCTDTKTCYYTPDGMKCNSNFVPCIGSSGLSVSYIYVTCASIKNLAVKAI